jgi:hypothetical protein
MTQNNQWGETDIKCGQSADCCVHWIHEDGISYFTATRDSRLVIHFNNTISANKINTNCINHPSPFLPPTKKGTKKQRACLWAGHKPSSVRRCETVTLYNLRVYNKQRVYIQCIEYGSTNWLVSQFHNTLSNAEVFFGVEYDNPIMCNEHKFKNSFLIDILHHEDEEST